MHLRFSFSIFVFLRIFIGSILFGQSATSNWYFGNKTALTFTTNPPSPIFNSSMYTSEGCMAISDLNGNLLFYSSGDTVWNSQHAVMANGTGLFGHKSTTQSALAIRSITNNEIYYLFTLDHDALSNGLRYSIIDMNLAAGMGSVTIKNVPLYSPSLEKLAAVKHCNGSDYWIVSHEAATNNYRSYLLTASGVSTTPVVSAVGGTIATLNGSTYYGTAGQLKFSATGKKMGAAMQVGNNSYAMLYDFNNSTGVVTNPTTLGVTPTQPCYGCEFSPDGTKFYSNLGSKVVQWDLCAGSSSAVIVSAYTVTNLSSGLQFQLAENGKIYISQNTTSLSVINTPNLQGSACNYSYVSQPLGTFFNSGVSLGLPNFTADAFNNFTYTKCLTSTTATFYPPPFASSASSCALITNSVSSLSWNFGDPSTGSANTSTLSTPVHSFSQLGTYVVTLTVNYVSCAPSVIVQTVNLVTPTVSILQSSATCNGLSSAKVVVLGSPGPFTYTWQPSTANTQVVNGLSGNQSVTVSSGGCQISTSATIVTPLTITASAQYTSSCTSATAVINVSNGSGIYTSQWSSSSQTGTFVTGLASGVQTFTVYDLLNSCSISNSIQVAFLPSPTIAILGNFTICSGNSATLSAVGANTYSWSGGNGYSPSIVVSPTFNTVFLVTGTNSFGCTSNNSITVVIGTPTITTSGSQIVCAGSAATIVANGASNYTWVPGPVYSPTLIASPTVNTSYTVTGVNTFGCTKNKAVSLVLTNSIPTVVVSGNLTICSGKSTTISASGANTYSWSITSSNVATIAVSPASTTSYTVVGTNSLGCNSTSIFTVTVYPSPSISITGNNTICAGEQTTLSVTGASNYTWSITNFTSHVITVNPLTTAVYSVISTNSFGCSGTKSISVFVNKCLGFIELEQFSLRILPFAGQPSGFLVQMGNFSGPYHIWVHNSLGQELLNVKSFYLQNTAPSFVMELDGLFVITIQTEFGIQKRKILIE